MQKSTPTQIGNRFAVTAAHCLYDESKEEVLPSYLLVDQLLITHKQEAILVKFLATWLRIL